MGLTNHKKSLNPGRGLRHPFRLEVKATLSQVMRAEYGTCEQLQKTVRKETVTSVLQLQEDPELFLELTCFRI